MKAGEPAGPGLVNWALISCLGLLWGASFMGVTLALDGFGPLSVAAYRIALAAVVLLAVTRVMGIALPMPATAEGRAVLPFAIGMGLFSNAFPFFLLSWGQQHVASGFAGITMSAIPLLVLPLAHLFVPGEQLTARKGLGFAIGFVGVVILIGPGAFRSAGGDLEGLARLACLAAAACYAIGAILTRRCPPVHPIAFGAVALSVATALLLPVALWREGLATAPGTVPLLAILYLGLGPTALATLILVRVIRSAGPSFLSLTNYKVPVWSVIFGAVFLGERLPPQFLAALAVILAGLAITQLRMWKRGFRAPAPGGR